MTTKPTGEELWWKYCTRGATTIQRDLADCFDAGIQHAREEMAQAGQPEPAPASEELVERIAEVIRISEGETVRCVWHDKAARAVLAEIGPAVSGQEREEMWKWRGETEKELDAARTTISTLEARVKELEGDQLSAGREVERLMREYCNARKLHQAEVEKLDRELGDAQFVARETQSELEARDEELNSAREELRALVDALKFEESL